MLRDDDHPRGGASARIAAEPLVLVTVGSRIRFDTTLLQQIQRQVDHRSPLVEVERLVREVDGTITIWVKNAAGLAAAAPALREADVPLPWPESPL